MADASLTDLQRAFRVRWFDILASLLLAAGAFGLLCLWRYPAPFPGEATRTLAELTGAWPRLTAFGFLWNLLARTAVRTSPDATFRALQVLAYLFVSLSVGLFHATSLRFLFGSQTEHSSPRWTPLFCRIGAISGALVFLGLPPVWHAAQAPCAAALGLFLCVLTTRLSMSHAEAEPSRAVRLFLPLIAAIALLETPAALVIVPLLVLFHFSLELGIEKVDVSPLNADELPAGEPPEEPIPSPSTDQPTERPTDRPTDRLTDRQTDGQTGSLYEAVFSLVRIVLFLGILIGGAHWMVRAFHPMAALYRGSSSLPGTALLLAQDIVEHLETSLPTAEALTLSALVLFPAIAVIAITRRSLSGDQHFTDSLIFFIVGALLLLQTSREPSLSIWTLLPSASFQAVFAFLAAFLLPPAVAAFFVQARSIWIIRRGDPEALASGWDDPDRASPFIYASLARVVAVIGLVLALAPAARLFACREPRTHAALTTLDAYTHELSKAIGTCRYFVSDGWHSLALRTLRPDILPLPYTDSGERRSPSFPGDNAVRASLLPDGFSRSLMADPAGWPLLIGDWLAFNPSNVYQTAIQTGFPLWYNADRFLPDMSLGIYGLVIHPLSSGPAPDVQDAEDWFRRFDRLKPVQDTTLAATVLAIRDRLQDFQNPDFSPASNATLPPLDFLEELPLPPPMDTPLPGVLDAPISPALAAELYAVAQSAVPSRPSPRHLDAAFARILERIRETEPCPIVVDDAPKNKREQSELENLDADPSARLLDLVHAYLLLRASHSSAEAGRLLEPYHYHLTLDPAFWYLWGLYKSDTANAFGLMEAQEMLGKFPEHALLRSLLDVSHAASTADAKLELDSLRAALSDLPSDLSLLRRALRLQLRIGPEDRVGSAREAAPHAKRLLRYDATDPLAHLVLALEALYPAEPDQKPSPSLSAGHFRRAIEYLPAFTHPFFQPLADTLASGQIPPENDLPTVTEILDADRAAARRTPSSTDSLLFPIGLILQHFDNAAINSRYVVDPLLNK